MKTALARAGERAEEEAETENDPEVFVALTGVAEMLRYLSMGAGSPLFDDLRGEVFSSGGDGRKRELDLITASVAAFLMLCGFGQNHAAKEAVQLCKHSSVASIKRNFLAGAIDADSVKNLKSWKEIELRLKSAERYVRYSGYLDSRTKDRDSRLRVVERLVLDAQKLKSQSAQL